jgi:hypothetical protein
MSDIIKNITGGSLSKVCYVKDDFSFSSISLNTLLLSILIICLIIS